jgi:Ca-activated chloride channel family protein
MCTVGAGKSRGLTIDDVGASTGCGQFISAIERAKVHSGPRSDWLFEQMTSVGPEYLDAIISYEFEVIQYNKTLGRSLREPLVAVYPQDGTIVVGHPLTILDGVPWVSAQQAAAARVFQRFLLSAEPQKGVIAMGFRPADPSIAIGAPIEPANGVNPQANILALEVPDTAVVDQVVEVWHRVKKHAVIAIVFDKSGSMAGGKMSAAIKGAQGFACTVGRDDRLFWQPFDGQV